jgi:HEAT repeat protein
MGFLKSLFSGSPTEKATEDAVARRLGAVVGQQAKMAAAEQIWPMIRGAIHNSALGGRLNVVVAGGAELSPADTRRLASSGLQQFQESAQASVRKEEKALSGMIDQSPHDVAEALLAIVTAESRYEPDVRRLAGHYLVHKLGEDIAPDLIAALGAGNEYRRYYAAQTLRLKEIKTSPVVEALVGALHDPDGDVRREAAQALGPLGDSTALAALLAAAADDPEARVKEAAAASARALEPAAAASGH